MHDDVAGPDGSALSEGLGPLPATSYTLASGGSFTWVRGWDEKQLLAFAARAVAAERARWMNACATVAAGAEAAGRPGAQSVEQVRHLALRA